MRAAQGRAAGVANLFRTPRDERGISPLIDTHFDDKFLANKGIDY